MESNKRFIVRDSVAGNIITSFDTLEEAQKEIRDFEKEDKEEGIFEFGFYEIFDDIMEEVIE